MGWRGRRDSNPQENATNRRRLNSLGSVGRVFVRVPSAQSMAILAWRTDLTARSCARLDSRPQSWTAAVSRLC
jgi:hypothetical protein